MSRVNPSKKIRFEVFKRDSFTCQYCGKAAPDIILELDHIFPVTEALKKEWSWERINSITNLVTSCENCNSGKKATLLSDRTTVKKVHASLTKLQEKRAQLEMMLEWREELLKLDDKVVNLLGEEWTKLVGATLTEVGKNNLRKLLKKFDFTEITEAMDIATNYVKKDSLGKTSFESLEVAFNKIGGICTNKKRQIEDPSLAKIYYLKGILRNKDWFNERRFWTLISRIKKDCPTADWDYVQEIAKESSSLSNFQERIEQGGVRVKQ